MGEIEYAADLQKADSGRHLTHNVKAKDGKGQKWTCVFSIVGWWDYRGNHTFSRTNLNFKQASHALQIAAVYRSTKRTNRATTKTWRKLRKEMMRQGDWSLRQAHWFCWILVGKLASGTGAAGSTSPGGGEILGGFTTKLLGGNWSPKTRHLS